jgi:hypothetical protein
VITRLARPDVGRGFYMTRDSPDQMTNFVIRVFDIAEVRPRPVTMRLRALLPVAN